MFTVHTGAARIGGEVCVRVHVHQDGESSCESEFIKEYISEDKTLGSERWTVSPMSMWSLSNT